MTELEEVAQAIHEKRVHKHLHLTFADARALAYLNLPKGESQNVIDGVAEALMAYNTKDLAMTVKQRLNQGHRAAIALAMTRAAINELKKKKEHTMSNVDMCEHDWPVSEARRSAAELFSDVLMCQRNQVETLTGDPYMVGLHNGMSMMIANFDNAPDFECLSVSEAKAQDEYGDAYQGAREDLAIWKRRALEAEKALQEERIITERLGNALNEENGPTFMGEPVFPAKAQGVVMPTVDQAMRVVLREMGNSTHVRGTSNWCADVGRAVLEEVARLNAAPAATAADAWIPVSERLPDIAQEVIVHSEFDGVCAGVLDSYGEWFAPCSEYKLIRVTSWMPMPTKIEANRHDQ